MGTNNTNNYIKGENKMQKINTKGLFDFYEISQPIIVICKNCKKEIQLDLEPGINEPVQEVYYSEETYEIICKECYEKAYYNASK